MNVGRCVRAEDRGKRKSLSEPDLEATLAWGYMESLSFPFPISSQGISQTSSLIGFHEALGKIT